MAKDFLPSENYLSVEDIARELDVTTRTVRNYIRRGLLKGYKISNKWWFSKENLYHLIGNLAVDQTMTITVNDFLLSKKVTEMQTIVIIKYPIVDLRKNEQLIDSIIKEINRLKENSKSDTNEFYYRIIGSDAGQILLKGTVSFVMILAQFIEEIVRKYQNS